MTLLTIFCCNVHIQSDTYKVFMFMTLFYKDTFIHRAPIITVTRTILPFASTSLLAWSMNQAKPSRKILKPNHGDPTNQVRDKTSQVVQNASQAKPSCKLTWFMLQLGNRNGNQNRNIEKCDVFNCCYKNKNNILYMFD